MTTMRRLACFLLLSLAGGICMTTHAADANAQLHLTQAYADAFARDWIDGWNSHDIERILAHYSADFEMRSPLIAQRGFSATGQLVGKEAVRAYWTPAVAPGSTLRFELLQAFVSVDSIAIHYRSNSSGGRLCVEVLQFNADGQVIAGAAHYFPAIEAPAN
jgi:ketosteroid isomerase-like protein